MSNTHFIEDCVAITPKEVTAIATNGKHKKYPVDIDCWFDDADSSLVSIGVNKREPQVITLEMVDINFGQMTYFICNCGSRVLKLYKPSLKAEFRCRRCHNLRYTVCSFNKSIPGRAIYHMNRVNKIIETRATISHIFFKKEFTSRYSTFLMKCHKFGLHEVVENSLKLRDLINQRI